MLSSSATEIIKTSDTRQLPNACQRSDASAGRPVARHGQRRVGPPFNARHRDRLAARQPADNRSPIRSRQAIEDVTCGPRAAGIARYSASRSSARIRCDSGTGTCSAFERELNPVGSAGTGGCASRLRLRDREATPSLYAPGYFVSTCAEEYSRSARAAEEGIALCQESISSSTSRRTLTSRSGVTHMFQTCRLRLSASATSPLIPEVVPPLLTPEAYTRSSMDERAFARVAEDYTGRRLRPRIGLSVMPLETRREAIVGLATEGDRLGYDGFFLPETWAYDIT